MMFTRPAMEKFMAGLQGCLDRYAKCWAGDRRIGACMYDLNIVCDKDHMGDKGGYLGTEEVSDNLSVLASKPYSAFLVLIIRVRK